MQRIRRLPFEFLFLLSLFISLTLAQDTWMVFSRREATKEGQQQTDERNLNQLVGTFPKGKATPIRSRVLERVMFFRIIANAEEVQLISSWPEVRLCNIPPAQDAKELLGQDGHSERAASKQCRSTTEQYRHT